MTAFNFAGTAQRGPIPIPLQVPPDLIPDWAGAFAFSARPDAPAPQALDELAQAAEGSLGTFLRHAWPILEPGTPFAPNWHLDLLAEYLEAVSAGEIRRLVINVPPRSAKSTLVTICWPVWVWLRRPASRWMFVSYSQRLSELHSDARRTLIASEWYQRHWGSRYALTHDTILKVVNSAQGRYFTTSIGGSATGAGGNFLVLDDPHNPKEVESDQQRETVINDFRLTFSTRLDQPKTDAIVLVMQRLHERDLTAHCLSGGDYTHLSLPMTAETPTQHVFPHSGRIIERAAGDLLHPDRWGAPEVASMAKDLGPYGEAGQLQQRPGPLEGGAFKRAWWGFWYPADGPIPPVEKVLLNDGTWVDCRQAPLPAGLDFVITSWDMAFKDKKTSDWVAGGVWARQNAGPMRAHKYLLDQVRGHWSAVDSAEQVVLLAAKWPAASHHLIEDAANGPAIVDMLRDRQGGIIPIPPFGSKGSRVNASTGEVQSGNVWLPHPALFPWVRAFIAEHAAFPNGANDDQVDQGTQGRKFLDRGGSIGV